jgi:hypothetical protein
MIRGTEYIFNPEITLKRNFTSMLPRNRSKVRTIIVNESRPSKAGKLASVASDGNKTKKKET